jgi:hypothetical protein
MSARLSTAISLGDAANAILQRVKNFERRSIWSHEDWDENTHVGIEPMLLALAMELALKAWYVFDYDTAEIVRSHNLSTLFTKLRPESREKLATEFKEVVAPYHPGSFIQDYGIEDVLHQHANAFVDWRYLHEPKNMTFNESAFVATLEMVIHEFKKRYRVETVQPLWPSR